MKRKNDNQAETGQIKDLAGDEYMDADLTVAQETTMRDKAVKSGHKLLLIVEQVLTNEYGFTHKQLKKFRDHISMTANNAAVLESAGVNMLASGYAAEMLVDATVGGMQLDAGNVGNAVKKLKAGKDL